MFRDVDTSCHDVSGEHDTEINDEESDNVSEIEGDVPDGVTAVDCVITLPTTLTKKVVSYIAASRENSVKFNSPNQSSTLG